MSARKPGRPRVDTCKRGHDLTIEGARDKRGACVGCKTARYRERQAALPPKPVVHAPAIPEDMITELCRLQELSSKTIGTTPLGHEYRLAGDLLAELAMDAIDTYGVTVYKLAEQMGLSSQAMRFFLMRRGFLPMTPGAAKSQPAYENRLSTGRAGTRKATCIRGHDTSEPSARYGDGKGRCKECLRDRDRARAIAKKRAA